MSSIATGCKAGHCTACGVPVWRMAAAERADVQSGIEAGQMFLLWPAPSSVYARVQTPTGEAPGIAFCPACAPPAGSAALEGFGPVLSYEAAWTRYEAWYHPEREVFYRAWLRDALSLESEKIDNLMDTWKVDRGGSQVH